MSIEIGDDLRKLMDSGIEWIGEIPVGWTVKPLKRMAKFGKGLPITKDDLIEQGVPVVSYGQIHSKTNNGTHLQDDLIRFVSETYLESNLLSLGKKGDIFFADTSEDYAGIGNAVLVDIDIPVFAGYHTVIVRPDDQSYSRYLAYLFLTDAWRNQLCSRASGIKVFSITQGLLKKTTVILPPSEKAVAMTDYLDRKCSQIDAIIARQQEVIEKLKAYKLSVITEAVTKGLNPDVPMKDSGVEWIGEIPEHWDTLKLQTHTRMLTPMRDKPERLDGDIPWVRIEDYDGKYISTSKEGLGVSLETVKEMNLKIYPVGSILCTSSCDLGKCAIVTRELVSNQRFINIIPDSNTNSDYLYYLMLSNAERLNHLSTGTIQANLSRKAFEHLMVQFPPISEQKVIAEYLDRKCEAVELSISKKQELIDRLSFYKKSLIYEVVTGKKEV